MAGKQTTRSAIALALLFLFGLPFAVVGLVADIGMIRLAYDDLRMLRWREVPCSILATDLNERHGDDSTMYHVTARYRYEVDGKEHFGQRVALDDSDDNNGSFQKRIHAELEKYRTSGQPFRCYVNPSRPDESILYRGVRWGIAALQTLAALMFSAVGFGLLGAVIASRFGNPKRNVLETSGLTPWKRRADWARGEIRHSDRTTGTVLVWAGLAVLLVSVRSLLASGLELVFGDDALAVLGLLPSGIGLLLLTVGRHKRARWRWYGDSILQLAAVPGVVGGSLAGVVRVERRVESPEGFIVRLHCLESTHSSSGSDNNSSIRVVWEEERTIIHEMRSADSEGVAIPVYFAIPFDVLETAEGPGHAGISWTLSVRSVSPGADYKAEFSVPVFRTSDSSPDYKPDESVIANYLAPVDSQAPLRKAGLQVEPLENGGVLFGFPPGRNVGLAIFMLLLQSVFVVAIVALCYFKWSVAWPFVAAFLGACLLYSIVDLFAYRSDVEVTSAGLSVQGGIFNLGSRRDIAVADLDRVVADGAGSSGSTFAFDLFAVMRSGKRVRLAKRIWPQSAADMVIQKIEEVVSHGNRVANPLSSRDG